LEGKNRSRTGEWVEVQKQDIQLKLAVLGSNGSYSVGGTAFHEPTEGVDSTYVDG